ncbi:MAG: hypothetical protein EOP56_13940 [Sphingobacteriales bacterium]|nr:MAG: hypothetical protein EOP56_13940 [Sphingobacteriales bacterium]
MVQKLIKNSITINANPDIIWDLLTNPEQTKKYMFGCETVSDWKPGSPLVWKMMHEGKEFIPVKGNIVSIVPGQSLSYTVIDPNSGIEDIPENYLTVDYNLEPSGTATILHVTQGDYNTVADGERRYQESYNNGEGWNPILVEIKKLAESGF